MNLIWIMLLAAHAQSDLEVSDEQNALILGGFAACVVGIFLYLARDVILGKKTSYDQSDMESKKEKTFEKYHSGWGDDYEEVGKRYETKNDKEFREGMTNEDLPDYYGMLGVGPDATQKEIKERFRHLAKQKHPDKTEKDTQEEMVGINKAYSVLSDKQSRAKYDRYFKPSL